MSNGNATPSEGTLENWENTDPNNGTYKSNIVSTLNSHYSNYGHWATYSPSGTTDLINQVKYDTYNFQQMIIQNIDTGYLSFWNGHSLKHYDTLYGWGSGQVKVDEEWDPVFTWGSSSYGNPYGLHPTTSVTDDYHAISQGPSGLIVE